MVSCGAKVSRVGREPTALALRSLAALVALLLVGSSLGQVAHFLAVQHAVCIEHGELVELHPSDGHGAAEARSHDGHESEDEGSGAPRPGEHDHCQLLAKQEREQAVAPRPAIGIATAQLELQPAPARAQDGALAQPLFSLAPKTSPPVRAAG